MAGLIYRQPGVKESQRHTASIPQTGNDGCRARGRTALSLVSARPDCNISLHTDTGTYFPPAATNLLLPTRWMRMLVFVPRQRRCTIITLRYAPVLQGNPWRLGPQGSPWINTPGQASFSQSVCAHIVRPQTRRLAGCGEGSILGGWEGHHMYSLKGGTCPC